MALGKNVGKMVSARGLSYGDVARGIGLEDGSQAIWSLVKRDSKKSQFASRLADYFRVPLSRLLAEDFDPSEAGERATDHADGVHEMRLNHEEALAIKRLRGALPKWRNYVLGLAVIDNHGTQQLLLDTMTQTVSDRRVEANVPIAPHVTGRRR